MSNKLRTNLIGKQNIICNSQSNQLSLYIDEIIHLNLIINNKIKYLNYGK